MPSYYVFFPNRPFLQRVRINHKQREDVTTSPSAHNSSHHVCKQRENVTSFCWWDCSKSKIPCHKQTHTHTHFRPRLFKGSGRCFACLALLVGCWFVSCFRSKGTHEPIDLRETCASNRSKGTATTTTTTTLLLFWFWFWFLFLLLEAAKHVL